MKILLVDDSGTMRAIQSGILSELGFEDVLQAADGVQALKIIAAEKIDLVMLDWNMPIMTGIETLRRIKADPVKKSIPVVMVTTEAEKVHILDAITVGAAGYILKPFSPQTLKERLTPFLKK